jgi:hypothetical protein
VTGTLALVVEALGPGDGYTAVNVRLLPFLRRGVEVWLVDSETRSLIVYRPGTHLHFVSARDEREGRERLSDPRCLVADFFAQAEQ